MEWITGVFLVYIFISLYFLSLVVIIYLHNRKNLFDSPELKTHFSISAIVPCWNEGAKVLESVERIMETDYDNLKEIILVNDGSTDDTLNWMKKAKQKYKIIKIINKKNSGKADSFNYACKFAKGELIAVIDSDSFPNKDVFSKLVGYFEDPKVGVATVPHLSRRRDTFLDKLHTYFQILVASDRKFLEKINGIYVTPGPMSLYRKSALESVKGMDTKNITEDVELTWHLAMDGWKRKICLATYATTLLPNKFKSFYNQRLRWSIGGLQTVIKYRKQLFKKNVVGYFILPYFSVSMILAIFSVAFFFILLFKNIYLEAIRLYSFACADSSFLMFFDFNFLPQIILIFGLFLFIVTTIFSMITLMFLEKNFLDKKRNILFFILSLFILGILHIIIFVHSIFKYLKKDITWLR